MKGEWVTVHERNPREPDKYHIKTLKYWEGDVLWDGDQWDFQSEDDPIEWWFDP